MGLLEDLKATPAEEAGTVTRVKPSQQDALDFLTTWWKSKDQNAILSGEPGSGKTWLSAYFTNCLDNAFPLFTAPTNEAVRNLEIALPNNIKPATTYSALGLKMSDWSSTQRIYQGKIPDGLDSHNLIVVDEASMADMMSKNPDAAMQLLDYIRETDIRTLWLGDEVQLPPVPDKHGHSCPETVQGKSPIFHLDFPRYHLSEVVRHEGPVLEYARMIREQIVSGTLKYVSPPEGVDVITGKEFNKYILESKVFDSIIAGDTKIIAWTNKRVDAINLMVRTQMYGRPVAMTTAVCPGDQIIFTKPLMSTEVPLFRSHPTDIVGKTKIAASINTKAEVMRTEVVKIWGIECYMAELNVDGLKTMSAYIVTARGQGMYKKLCQILRSDAISKKKSKVKGESATAWRLYYAVTGLFAQIKHSYALTGHRAQGSTIKNVIVDANNMLLNPQRRVGMKNFYVGLTRTAEHLTVIKG